MIFTSRRTGIAAWPTTFQARARSRRSCRCGGGCGSGGDLGHCCHRECGVGSSKAVRSRLKLLRILGHQSIGKRPRPQSRPLARGKAYVHLSSVPRGISTILNSLSRWGCTSEFFGQSSSRPAENYVIDLAELQPGIMPE
jgi:hypothetical protein